MDRIGDQKAEYLDGSSGPYSTAFERRGMGYDYGSAGIGYFMSRLQPGESVKIVAHSQGVAYSMGLADALMENGINVEIAYALAPKQGKDIRIPEGLKIRQFHSQADLIANYGLIKGAQTQFTPTKTIIKSVLLKGIFIGPHTISGFNWIFKLPFERGVGPSRYNLRF
jgi:hypothetical protein